VAFIINNSYYKPQAHMVLLVCLQD